MAGTLYIVATPIGNLEDITRRALRILGEVDLIAAEDTRHSKKLLHHFNIATPLISYYREKEQQRAEELIAKLHAGTNIALISDAGTPAISDPGAIVVNMARQASIPIVPVPGPSALTAAVSCAGLIPGEFLFVGFAPPKSTQRCTLLRSLRDLFYPLVFYEAPHRIERFLKDCLEILGDREILWARELSKKYEEITHATLGGLLASLNTEKLRGESVFIIYPPTVLPPSSDTIEKMLEKFYEQGELSMKDSCREVAKILGVGRSTVYQRALAIWNNR
jgi:16S rRNA (cytidine1402-2'-O)-methyltransferase